MDRPCPSRRARMSGLRRGGRDPVLLGLALLCCAPLASSGQQPEAGVVALINGRWLVGDGFVERTLYMEGGVLHETPPATADSVIDLAGGFVIPPFGDAHTHNLDGLYSLEQVRDQYLTEGTFYVAVLTNSASGAARAIPVLDRPCSLDVVYAHGGLTSTLSHPFLAYEPRAMGLYADWESHADEIRVSRLREGDAYWFVDSIEDLAAQWPSIRAGRPSIVKVFLLDAVEDPPTPVSAGLPAGRGLRPSLVPEIVRRAHAAGFRVAAHVETAGDFAVAVDAGVDLVAHMPGYLLGARSDGSTDRDASTGRYEIPEAVAREAGARSVIVTPTVAWTGTASGPDSVALVQRRRELMKRNLAVLREHGVRVVLGSDWFGETGRHEIHAMRELGAWTDTELLRMWAVETPRAIFPGRAIGRLEPGFEASFLVLEGDPTVRWDALRSIRLRVKQGCVLSAP